MSGIWRLLTQTKEANGTGTHLSRKPSHITPSLGKDDRGGPEEPARARQTSANSLSRWPHPSLIRSGPIRTCQPQQRCEREPGRAVGQITRADIIDDGEWYDVKVPDGPHHKNLTKVLNPNPDYSYPYPLPLPEPLPLPLPVLVINPNSIPKSNPDYPHPLPQPLPLPLTTSLPHYLTTPTPFIRGISLRYRTLP